MANKNGLTYGVTYDLLLGVAKLDHTSMIDVGNGEKVPFCSEEQQKEFEAKYPNYPQYWVEVITTHKMWRKLPKRKRSFFDFKKSVEALRVKYGYLD